MTAYATSWRWCRASASWPASAWTGFSDGSRAPGPTNGSPRGGAPGRGGGAPGVRSPGGRCVGGRAGPRPAHRLAPGRRLGAAAATAVFASVGVQLIRIHPYQGAYLNEAVNAWLPGRAEDMFEVEYWQQSYKEGAEWLNAHAERDAEIFVAFDTRTADRYLHRPAIELLAFTLPS